MFRLQIEPRREAVASTAAASPAAAVAKEDVAAGPRGGGGEVQREEESVDLTKLTVVALKDILRKKGLKVSGKKAELVERLQQVSSTVVGGL